MNVLIPGSFVDLSPFHFKVFDKVISTLTSHFDSQINQQIYLIHQHPYNQQDTKEMLQHLQCISDVNIAKDWKISNSFIESHHISCIITFNDSFLEIDSNWPVINTEQIKSTKLPFIWQFNEYHPDFLSSSFLFTQRFSPSEFSRERVPRELINSAIAIANRSPSAGNLQAYKLVLVLKRETIEKIANACHQDRVLTSNGLFIFLEDPDVSSAKYRSRGPKYAQQDAVIACSHLQLALESLGITSRWIGAFKDDQVKSTIKSNLPVCGILIFGYPVLKERKSKRRSINEYLTIIE